MDDRLENEHEFKDTIRAAADVDEDVHERHRRERLDSEIAYEMLAVSSSMGMFGMEETAANLMQLELAREMLYREQQLDGTIQDENNRL